MKIGIIVAMGKELKLLLNLIENMQEEILDGYKVYEGDIGVHKVYAMQCGIGKVNAAVGTYVLVSKYAPELVINTGVAGSADRSVGQMDVVACSRIAYHDVWCGPGTEYGEASGFPLYFESSSAVMDVVGGIKSACNIKSGLICSGDKFIDSKDVVAGIKRNFPDVLAVDMESAAIAQVCYMKNVPVFVLRVISDSPEDSDDNAAQYEDFWDKAPEHTFAILSEILQKIG